MILGTPQNEATTSPRADRLTCLFAHVCDVTSVYRLARINQVQRAVEGREEARGGRVEVEQRTNKVACVMLACTGVGEGWHVACRKSPAMHTAVPVHACAVPS